MSELVISYPYAPGEETPVDEYLKSLLQAGTENDWERIPTEDDGYPSFRFHDTRRALVTTLTCKWNTREYVKYCMESRDPDGTVEMRTAEWVSPASDTGDLQRLYKMLYADIPPKEADAPAEEESAPEKAALDAGSGLTAILADQL